MLGTDRERDPCLGERMKISNLDALIAKHFPCVGCERVTGKPDHHVLGCPVTARRRALALVREISGTGRGDSGTRRASSRPRR